MQNTPEVTPVTPEPTTINIPVLVPDALMKMGFVELYATKKVYWTPQISKTTYSEDGTPTTEVIDNPETAEQACIRFNQNRIKDESKEIFLELQAEQARLKALETFNSVFN